VTTYERWYSARVEQDIGLAAWGHYGTPVLIFPTAGGDAQEIERHHLVSACAGLLDAGRIKIYSCDSVAGAAMLAKRGSVEYQMRLLNAFHDTVVSEIVPAIYASSGGSPLPVLAAGSSIGAFNALAMVCRYPSVFGSALCLSGTYRLQRFFDGAFSQDLYFSSPLDFLPGLEGPQLDLLRQRFVLLASGEGAWENIGESWAAADVLGRKGIPNRVDNWGPEYEHEWPTWWQMYPTYLDQLA
jgi:esterase/lipase superfamily enzyme